MSLLDRLEQLKQRLSTRPQFKRLQSQRNQSRDPYVFQIGFDFGTSYSKCVIRDRDKAFVFSFDLQGKTEFLLSSSILYRDGFFSTNTANQLYPEHGLWYIKMALVELAHRNFSAPVLEHFNTAAGAAPGSIKLQNFVLSAALFYLSRALGKIRSYILSRYPDYGKHERDDMFVTMAIPVSNMADRETETLFLRLLKKAWAMACDDSHMAESASWKEMAGLIAKPTPARRECKVYPEVSANIQVFLHSPASPGRTTNIYLVTDIGAGTVDQCCFTFYNRDREEDKLNYLSAQVFELGSSVIDQLCANEYGHDVEYWRKQKENGSEDKHLHRVLDHVSLKLSNKFVAVSLRELTDHLYRGNGLSPDNTVCRLCYILFSGGGDMDHPYHTAVLNGLRRKMGLPIREVMDGSYTEQWASRIINVQKPGDLELPKGCEHWMKRLLVAYGLSFYDLPGNRFPDETAIAQNQE